MLFSIAAVRVYAPTRECGAAGSDFPASSPTPSAWLFGNSHANGLEVTSHCALSVVKL